MNEWLVLLIPHAETAEWMTRLTDIYEGFQEVQIFLSRISS